MRNERPRPILAVVYNDRYDLNPDPDLGRARGMEIAAVWACRRARRGRGLHRAAVGIARADRRLGKRVRIDMVGWRVKRLVVQTGGGVSVLSIDRLKGIIT